MKIHILYTLIILGFAFSSCHVTRHIETSKVNVDSIVTRVKDSMSQVRIAETTELNRRLSEITSSGVTFVVDSCPERESVLLLHGGLLDSAGRANYEKALLESKIKSLSNKVSISEKGVITAEGRIKEAFFSNSKLQEELQRTELTIDQLTKDKDSLSAQLTKSVEQKNKDVEKKFMPWWFWLLLPASALLTWIAKAGLDKWKQRRLIT